MFAINNKHTATTSFAEFWKKLTQYFLYRLQESMNPKINQSFQWRSEYFWHLHYLIYVYELFYDRKSKIMIQMFMCKATCKLLWWQLKLPSSVPVSTA
jgi:hypothetical protein